MGVDVSQIDVLFGNAAMALAELYLRWKDIGKLDYDRTKIVLDQVTGFAAAPKSIAFLLWQLTGIKHEVSDEDGIRGRVELWKDEGSGEITPEWMAH